MKIKDIIKEFERLQAEANDLVRWMGKPCRNMEEDIKTMMKFFEYLDKDVEFVN